ncbi:uncharacterized protein V6R79_022873 [Siganus canaliculatus]
MHPNIQIGGSYSAGEHVRSEIQDIRLNRPVDNGQSEASVTMRNRLQTGLLTFYFTRGRAYVTGPP